MGNNHSQLVVMDGKYSRCSRRKRSSSHLDCFEKIKDKASSPQKKFAGSSESRIKCSLCRKITEEICCLRNITETSKNTFSSVLNTVLSPSLQVTGGAVCSLCRDSVNSLDRIQQQVARLEENIISLRRNRNKKSRKRKNVRWGRF